MGVASIKNLDYVVLLCEDLVRARKFYLEVMKFRLERETPNWVSFLESSIMRSSFRAARVRSMMAAAA